MAKVTEKNTKKEILEALKEAEAKLAERREANTTTADVVRAKEVEAKKNDAKEIVEMNILNSDITAKYKNLLDTVDMLEREIQELHEVKAGLDTLEALMIVQNNKKATFETEMAEKKANFDELMAQKKAEEEADIEALKARYNKLSAELREEYAELRKELEKTRKREAEEFEYNLKRERAIENDRWADEKASREKVLAAKEAAVAEREALAEEKDIKISTLMNEIASLEAKAKENIAIALKEGEAKAEKTCAIKIAGIKKDAEWQDEIAKREIASLKAALKAKEEEAAELRSKLDNAYTRIQEMAIEQSKASTPRLVETTK